MVVGISTAHAAVLRALRNYIRPSLHDLHASGYDSGYTYRGGSLDGLAAPAAVTAAAPLDASGRLDEALRSDYVCARRQHIFFF